MHEGMFLPAQRSVVVDFILKRTSFTKVNDDVDQIGIDRLIDNGDFIAAYPLHDVSKTP